MTFFIEISKNLIQKKNGKLKTSEKRRYTCLTIDIDRFSLTEPSLGCGRTSCAQCLDHVCHQSKLPIQTTLVPRRSTMYIRRIHHWHLNNIFLVHSSYTDLTAKNINDSSSTRLAELRNSVRNSLMWL